MTGKRRVAIMIDIGWFVKHHTEVYLGSQQYAEKAGWDCTVDPFADESLKSRRDKSSYDGVIARATPQLVKRARLARVPVVNVWENSPAKDVPSVLSDSEATGRMAAEHLIARGFRRFAYLGFRRDKCQRDLLKGFRSVLRPPGFSASTHLISRSGYARNAESWKAFRADLAAWVETFAPPIGVCCQVDLVSRYLVDVCRARGLHVPVDVALIDDGNEHAICSYQAPTLSSIDRGYTQVGYRAAELLDRMMDGEPAPAEPIRVAPAELIPRASTDVFAVGDPLVAQAMRYIAEHGHEAIHVDDVAQAVAANRRALERRFRKTLGRPIAEEIVRLRIERVKRRLVETEDSMKAVAHASGFTSANHLYKAFIRVEGMSPVEYRRQRLQSL